MSKLKGSLPPLKNYPPIITYNCKVCGVVCHTEKGSGNDIKLLCNNCDGEIK